MSHDQNDAHRLAALASAPEQHSANGEVQKGEVTIAEREARRQGADSFGGKDFASAPAGDEVIAQARRFAAELVIADGGQHDRAKSILNGSHDEGPTVQAFAEALARPRAAVGEREAADRLGAALHDAEAIESTGVMVKCADLRAILALQSPPAKVEG